MSFLKGLSLGYEIMLIGIAVFFIGIIIMFLEGLVNKKSNKDIKEDYLEKSDVRTSDNPEYDNNNSSYINPKVDNSITKIKDMNLNSVPEEKYKANPNVNNEESNDLLNMYK